MTQDELNQLKALIQDSQILSIIEKSEWLQLLPDMNDQQTSDLAAILASAAEVQVKNSPVQTVPQPPQPPKPMPKSEPHAPVRVGKVDITEKELPAPAAQPMSSQAPEAAKPQPAAAQASRAEPKPAPQIPRAADSTEEIFLKTPDDFLGLTPAILHDQNASEILARLYQAVQDVGGRDKLLAVIYNLEQSPLYKTYVNVGVALLNDPTKSRDEVYTRLADDAIQRGEDYMAKDEFEAFTDFRRELDKLLV